MHIKELKVDETTRDLLKELAQPLQIAKVAAILDVSYNTASAKLRVWEAKEWVVKIERRANRRLQTLYYLNQNEIQLDEE
jgi:Fic family protein